MCPPKTCVRGWGQLPWSPWRQRPVGSFPHLGPPPSSWGTADGVKGLCPRLLFSTCLVPSWLRLSVSRIATCGLLSLDKGSGLSPCVYSLAHASQACSLHGPFPWPGSVLPPRPRSPWPGCVHTSESEVLESWFRVCAPQTSDWPPWFCLPVAQPYVCVVCPTVTLCTCLVMLFTRGLCMDPHVL